MKQGCKSDLEALDAELLPAIEHTSELEGAATGAVLHDFIKVLEWLRESTC